MAALMEGHIDNAACLSVATVRLALSRPLSANAIIRAYKRETHMKKKADTKANYWVLICAFTPIHHSQPDAPRRQLNCNVLCEAVDAPTSVASYKKVSYKKKCPTLNWLIL